MHATARMLIGREDELAAIVGLLDNRERLPRVVLLHGEAGIGKTTVWLAGLEAATQRDYRLLTSRPSEAETGFAYSGLADLLGESSASVLSELPPIQRRALEAALLLGESETPGNDRAVATAFLGALRLLAREHAFCLAADDVQWLDAESLAALSFALARLELEPVIVLLSVRGDCPDWLRRAVPRERLSTIFLGTLSVGALRELLRARLEAAFPRPVLIKLWETSNGNPFFALELAGALELRGRALSPGEDLPIPSELGELLGARVRRLGGAAVTVTRAVAALAEPTVPLVAAAVGRRFEAGLEEALAARILEVDGEQLRFAHPLLGSAVSAHQSPGRRRSLHARLANFVPTIEEKARHLALAAVEPGTEVSSILEEAARSAHARGAHGSAAELAEQAFGLTPEEQPAVRRRRLLDAAVRHHEAGSSGRALELLEQGLAESLRGPERAAVLLHLAEVRSDVLGPREAVSVFYEALREAEGYPALQAEALHWLAVSSRVTEGVDRALEHARAAVRVASLAADERLECRALAAYALLSFNAGHGIPQAEMQRALELERTLPEPVHALATMTAYHQLDWSVELVDARRYAETLLAKLVARDDPQQMDPLFHLALIEWRAGNWPLAAQHADRTIEVVQEAGHEGQLATVMYPKAIVAAHRGRLDEARACCEWALADALENGAVITTSGHTSVLGFMELSQGTPADAVEHLRSAAEIRDSMGLREPGMRLELGDLLETLVATGELAEAEALLATWVPRAAALDRAWALAIFARCRGLLFAARGDLEQAFASFEDALGEHARTTDPFQHARTLLALGRTQRRAKKRGDARTTLEDALGRFEHLGAPLWAEQTRAELKRIGGRAPSRGELTEAERRIAELVAEGRSNKQVAAALFITERSVETALTRVYRKLGVRSRTELMRQLASNS